MVLASFWHRVVMQDIGACGRGLLKNKVEDTHAVDCGACGVVQHYDACGVGLLKQKTEKTQTLVYGASVMKACGVGLWCSALVPVV